MTGGEDRSVRVCSGETGEVEQTLYLSAISVWGVAALANGDIAASTNDGLVRVFTREAARQVGKELLQAYEEVRQVGVKVSLQCGCSAGARED